MKNKKMTIEQWKNRITDFGYSSELTIPFMRALWGENLETIERCLINAKCKEDYEHDLKVLMWEIDRGIRTLLNIREQMMKIYYEDINHEWEN